MSPDADNDRNISEAGLEISPVDPKEIAPAVKIKTAVSRDTYEALQGKKKTKEWMRQNCKRDFFEYRIGRSGHHVIAVRREKKIVAVASMHQRGSRMDVDGLHVAAAGEGIGTILLGYLEQLAREAGCEQMRISVFRSNESGKKFVQKHGYIGIGSDFREPIFGVMVDHYEREL